MGTQRRGPRVAPWGQCPGRSGLYKLPQALLAILAQGWGRLSPLLSPAPHAKWE